MLCFEGTQIIKDIAEIFNQMDLYCQDMLNIHDIKARSFKFAEECQYTLQNVA